MEETREAYTGSGYLRVRVTRAGGSLPVEGAEVVITEYRPEGEQDGNGELRYRLTTGNGGLTQTVILPAPAAGDSLRPGAAQPYSLYNVTVRYDGYYPVEGVGVPVFDRVTAVQPVDLMPVESGGAPGGLRDGRVMIYETPDSQSLQPGGVQREDVGNKNGMLTDGYDEEGGGET